MKHWIQAQGDEGTVTVATPENGTYYIQVYSGQYANLTTNYTIGVSATPYETNWEAIGVTITVLSIVFGGMYGLIQQRKGKPKPVPMTSNH